MFYIVLVPGSRLPTRQKHGCSFFPVCPQAHILQFYKDSKVKNQQNLDLGSQYSYGPTIWYSWNGSGEIPQDSNAVKTPSPIPVHIKLIQFHSLPDQLYQTYRSHIGCWYFSHLSSSENHEFHQGFCINFAEAEELPKLLKEAIDRRDVPKLREARRFFWWAVMGNPLLGESTGNVCLGTSANPTYFMGILLTCVIGFGMSWGFYMDWWRVKCQSMRIQATHGLIRGAPIL